MFRVFMAAMVMAACSGGTPPVAGGGVRETASPAGLTDELLTGAVSGPVPGMRPGDAPHVARVFGSQGPEAAFFAGFRQVEDMKCRRWASGLPRSAQDVLRKDETSRIAGRLFADERGRVLGLTLLVAESSMVDELAAGSPGGCTGTWAEDQGRRIRVQVADVPAAAVGDHARGFRAWQRTKLRCGSRRSGSDRICFRSPLPVAQVRVRPIRSHRSNWML